MSDVIDIASENINRNVYRKDEIDLEVVYGYGLENTLDLWKQHFGTTEDFKPEWAYQEIIRENVWTIRTLFRRWLQR